MEANKIYAFSHVQSEKIDGTSRANLKILRIRSLIRDRTIWPLFVNLQITLLFVTSTSLSMLCTLLLQILRDELQLVMHLASASALHPATFNPPTLSHVLPVTDALNVFDEMGRRGGEPVMTSVT